MTADHSRKKPVLKNRNDPAIEASVLDFALAQPSCEQHRVSDKLRQRGIYFGRTLDLATP
jgi:hypothetical protein